MSEQHEFDPSIPHYGCHACNAEKLQEPVTRAEKPPDPSVRALLAQWRAKAEDRRQRSRAANHAGDQVMDAYHDGRSMALAECALDLEYALKPLADLAAEMQRCAEALKQTAYEWRGMATASAMATNNTLAEYFKNQANKVELLREQALAWAARLKALQEP